MAVQVQYRYGTTEEHASFVGGQQEITVDTTKNTLVVHNGISAGGYPLAKEDLSNVPNFTGATSGVAGSAGRVPVPQPGDQNKVLWGDGTWKTLPGLNIHTSSASNTTLVADYINNYVRLTNAGPKSIVIPNHGELPIPVGTTISGMSVGAGQLSFSGSTNVVINTPEGFALRPKPFVSFVLTKIGLNEWDLAGDLEAI